MPKNDLISKVFGRLTVIEESGRTAGRKIIWLCRCTCGTTTEVVSTSLINKNTRSCGCLRGTHGDYKKSLYSRWEGLKSRCLNIRNPRYYDYGGRGITICKRWLKYENFRDDMGATFEENLTIDRIDNNKGYCPENCHWVTRKEQQRNTRSNHLLTFQGETKTIAAWAEAISINPSTLNKRISRGWPVERALTEGVT